MGHSQQKTIFYNSGQPLSNPGQALWSLAPAMTSPAPPSPRRPSCTQTSLSLTDRETVLTICEDDAPGRAHLLSAALARLRCT